jgi:hypothetical protein
MDKYEELMQELDNAENKMFEVSETLNEVMSELSLMLTYLPNNVEMKARLEKLYKMVEDKYLELL